MLINNLIPLVLAHFPPDSLENERKMKNKTEKILWRKTEDLDIKLNETKHKKGLDENNIVSTTFRKELYLYYMINRK